MRETARGTRLAGVKQRDNPTRARPLVLAVLAIAVAAFGAALYEARAIDRGADLARRAQGLVSVGLVKLRVETAYPGSWEAKGGYLYRGKERIVEDGAKAHLLPGDIPPDAALTLGIGAPPAPVGEGPASASGLPFLSALGPCVALGDESGSAIGWISIGDGAYRRNFLEGRRDLAAVVALASLSLAAALLLGALALRLARPVDLVAEADEAARSRAEDRTRRDRLTGLLNRRGLTEAAVDPLSRHGLSHVAVLDIDDLRAYGDERGSEACDRLLCEVALTVVSIVRGADLCGRWEGDELIVVYRGLADDYLMIAGERLRAGVAARGYVSPKAPLRATITLGLAEIGAGGFEEAASAAQAAMRAGKAEGRNRVVLAPRGAYVLRT